MFRFRILANAAIIGCAFAAFLHAQPPRLSEQEAVNAIESMGGRVIRNSNGVVEFVDMKGEKFRDDHLGLLESVPTVRVLNLEGSQVTDVGVEQLMILPNLEEVSFRRTAVTPAVATALKERHPKVYFVQVERKGLHFERLAGLIVTFPMGLFGVWLIRLTNKKRKVLPPRLYARGILWGAGLILAATIFSLVAIVQTLGVDFHLSELFG